jgi:hypothetical protein
MENTLRQQTTFHEQLPVQISAPMNETLMHPTNLELKILLNWNQNLKIESQLNANYSFDNFL